jgi:hypothetical protein
MDCDTTHDADDIVTEEMVRAAGQALCDYQGDPSGRWNYYEEEARFVLRAVAPMIAARAQLSSRIEPAVLTLIAAEREAIAQLVEGFGNDPQLAAAIRARGET